MRNVKSRRSLRFLAITLLLAARLTLSYPRLAGDVELYLETAPELTFADYLGACIITLGDVIRLDYLAYPNVVRWLA